MRGGVLMCVRAEWNHTAVAIAVAVPNAFYSYGYWESGRNPYTMLMHSTGDLY